MKTKISTKLGLFLILASLVPLLFFGVLSVHQVRRATMQSIREGHQNVSQRAAEQIDQYIKNAISIIEATAENMNHAGLQPWQEERILENYINRFDQFNDLTLYDVNKNEVATTRLGKNASDIYQDESLKQGLEGQSYLSPVYIKEDLSPAMKVVFPVKKLTQVTGVLVGEVNLMHMWYLVDHIKIGHSGVLSIVGPEGRLIASGNGFRKKEVFSKSIFEPQNNWAAALQPQGTLYKTSYGEEVLAVGFKMADSQWSVIVEQPTSEAYALTRQMTLLLLVVMGLFIALASGVGVYAGRKQVVHPIRQLTQATKELSRGNLNYYITLPTGDEFEVLAEAFNEMVLKLKDIQQKLVVEERHSLFGRVASGLAHDLKHPIQAIETTSRLMEKMYDDEEFRKTFRRTVEREFDKINRFLSDLHNLVHETPLHLIPLKINTVLSDSLATFEVDAKNRKVDFFFEPEPSDPEILGDAVALNRVFSNMISNAVQAMPQGGTLKVTVLKRDGVCRITFKDTGMGIPRERLPTLFDDFVTTKSGGLGLGLAITKKIVSGHGGEIVVESEVGRGTSFLMKFSLQPA
ncbi:MAG: sensor histidine kinase [Deltaproteobacteria bacterium]|nr:MAG: sensor histidine kinase [Deltaproteobacteria bacterium]